MKANQEHLNFLLECTEDWLGGSIKWNEWREANLDIVPQLSGVDFEVHYKNYQEKDDVGYFRLNSFNLENANLENTNLKFIELAHANLVNANFENANLEGANLLEANLKETNFTKANLRHVNFQKSRGDFNFNGADFGGGNPEHIIRVARMDKWDNEAWSAFREEEEDINLQGAYLTNSGEENFYFQFDFSNVNLSDTVFNNTNFSGCTFRNTNLKNANLSLSKFYMHDFSGSNLSNALLEMTVLIKANFSEANLENASLLEANLTQANFTGANLKSVNFNQSVMIETIFDNANLSGSQVYGISAWDVSLVDTVQQGLNITKKEKHGITVDDLEVAQFIYLLINNEKIRNVINTVTSKTVLILGRFYKERKDVLDALREKLKEHDLAPIIFDFEPSKNRDLTETVQLLANMSKFVIADLTDAKSIPQELAHIIPFMPSIPVRPILLENEDAYSMFEHWEKFDSVLPVFYYKNQNHLIENIVSEVIQPIDDWKNGKMDKADAKEELNAVKQKFEELRQSNPERYKELQELGIIT